MQERNRASAEGRRAIGWAAACRRPVPDENPLPYRGAVWKDLLPRAIGEPMKSNHYQWTRGGPLPFLRRHSEVKHSLLRDYLVAYFQTLVSSPHQDRIQLTIVDGFCGGGRYLNEAGEIVPGSPLVSLRALDEALARIHFGQQRRKPLDMDVLLICIDENRSAIDHLRGVLEEDGRGEALRREQICLVTGTFAAHADAVLRSAAQRSPRARRTLFVLDQYGYDAVPVRSLAAIFQRLKAAEILLTFSVDALINYLNPKNLADFERKTGIGHAVSPEDLDKTLRDATWRLRIQSGLYQRLTVGSGAKHFTPFFIRPARGHGDFWLLHLSQHWKARDVMATTHWQHQNHFAHYGGAGFDMLSTGYAAKIDDEGRPQAMFEFDDAAAHMSLSTMQDQIPRLLVDNPDGILFDEFFAERSNTTPATKAMVEKTVLDLVREKEVEIVGLDGKVRNVRTALQSDHVVRLRSQRRFVF